MILLSIILITATWSLLSITTTLAYSPELHLFPHSIPVFHVRRDHHTSREVSRGRLEELGIQRNHQTINGRRKYSYDFLMQHLQCASSAPELNYGGALNLLQMLPLTRYRTEVICAWAESFCSPWLTCQQEVEENKRGKYIKSLEIPGSTMNVMERSFRSFRMLRVIDGSLYIDWPWGMERFVSDMKHISDELHDHYMLFHMVLSVVSDMKDSVFFFGSERSMMPWGVPFPGFSFAPQRGSADFPFPFVEMVLAELRLHQEASEANNFTDAYYSERRHLNWNDRIPKAAFFATLDSLTPRQLVYDQAMLRPDLFDASFSTNVIKAWDPSSSESPILSKQFDDNESRAMNHTGYAQFISKLWTSRSYTPGHYKYVIVPAGMGVMSLSGRLASLLAHSGAVILYQENDFHYHFSARLERWVHYVPLAYNMADATDMIEWLIDHDDLAQRLAINARNFGKSYLRLEDYYCYTATAMHQLANMQEGSDVLTPFNATRIPIPLDG